MSLFWRCLFFSTLLWLFQQVDAVSDVGRLATSSAERPLPARLTARSDSTHGRLPLIRRATRPVDGGTNAGLPIPEHVTRTNRDSGFPLQTPVGDHDHHRASAHLLEEQSLRPLPDGSFVPRSQAFHLLESVSSLEPLEFVEEKNGNESNDESIIKLLMAERDNSKKESKALAILFVGFTALVACVIFLVNHPDETLNRMTWRTMRDCIGDFMVLLLFYLGLEFWAWLLAGEEGLAYLAKHQQTKDGLPADPVVVWGHFVDFVAKFIVVSLLMWKIAKMPRLLYAFGTIGTLLTALNCAAFFTYLQDSPPFDTSPFMAMMVLPLAIGMGILMKLTGQYFRTKARNIEAGSFAESRTNDGDFTYFQAWDDQYLNMEDEVVAVTCGLLIAQICRFAITGDLPPPAGYKYKIIFPFHQTLFLLVCAIGFEVVAILISDRRHSSQHSDQIKAIMHTLQRTMSMSMVWCLYFVSKWTYYYAANVKGILNSGSEIFGKVNIALILTPLLFVVIVAYDRLAQNGWDLDANIDCYILLMGFVWEKTYEQAIVSIPVGDDSLSARVFYKAVFICALLLVIWPTWYFIVIPKANKLIDGSANPFADIPSHLIFQLGTNNWQRPKKLGLVGLEFAPGSGVLHEAHHNAYNEIPGVKCYSMYPSKNQSQPMDPEADYRVFELDHDIPICESASPNSSKRWHTMSEEEFSAYRERLEKEVYEYLAKCEEKEGKKFTMVIAHHSFLNPLVLRNVVQRRLQEGLPQCPIYCFVHGTALKMYRWELGGKNPEEFPPRFHKMIMEEKLFDDQTNGVNACFVISDEQKDGIREIFPSFPQNRVIVAPNGIDVQKFKPRKKELKEVIVEQTREILWPAVPTPEDCGKYTQMIAFVGKAAEWKRQAALLHAASEYEKEFPNLATLCVGTGPEDEIKKIKDLCQELDLKNTFLLGARDQDILADIYTVSNLGCFPSFREPFGLVFVECMACRTPVIGANSGGPKDFVTSDVGELVAEPPETTDLATVPLGVKTLGKTLNEAISRSLKEDWKTKKADACIKLVRDRFTVGVQVGDMLRQVAALK